MNQDKLLQIDEIINKEIRGERLRGASVYIEQRGKVAFNKVYGSDKEDSIYKIYSMTKPITAVAAMIMYERGLIDLLDPVGKYIPEYADMNVWNADKKKLKKAENPITINDLLNMTSGLVYPGENTYPERCMSEIQKDLFKRATSGEKMSNLKILKELAKAPLQFEPGHGWRYGLSADIVAGIIEVITGISYGEFLKKEIFEPLGMEDTGFLVPKEKIDRLAKMYWRNEDTKILRTPTQDEYVYLNEYAPTLPPFIESGGGGLYSTTADYVKFAKMLLNYGRYEEGRLLGRKTVEFLSSNRLSKEQMKAIDMENFDGYAYSNFMRIMLDPAKAWSNGSVGEYGWDGMSGTYFMVDPAEELIYVYMQQIAQGDDRSLRRRIRQIIYGAI